MHQLIRPPGPDPGEASSPKGRGRLGIASEATVTQAKKRGRHCHTEQLATLLLHPAQLIVSARDGWSFVTMESYVEVLKAVVSLAWPLLAATVLWKLWPIVKQVIESRAFTLKFAGIEVTAQEATQQINSQLQDLKEQILQLRRASGAPVEVVSTSAEKNLSKSILWTDDKPSNNALEISQLEGRGYKVLTALSTNEAMATLARENVGLIISDMGRREDGHYVPQAGLVLLRIARESGYQQPFIVYSSAKYADRNDAEVKASGGVGATASPTTLLEWIETFLFNMGRTPPQ